MRTNLNPNSANQQPSQWQQYRERPYRSRRFITRRIPRREWVEVNQITVEKTEFAVRIRFPEKPSDEQREHLKSAGFRWTPNGNFWYNKNSSENVAFATELETNGFPAVVTQPEDAMPVI
jgi:hypothetical protein